MIPFGSFKAGPTLALTFVAVSTSATNTVTSPSGIQAGDLIVIFDTAYNGSSQPGTVIPSGFTNGKLYTGLNGRYFKSLISHKIAVGNESSTVFSGMNSTSEVKCCWVFRPSQPIVSVTYAPTWGEETTSANPNPQSTTDAANQSGGSLLIVGAGQALDVDPVFVTESPAFDGTNVSGTGSTIHGRFGRKIYNDSPQDHTIDMNDQGTFNGLLIGWINVT